MATCPRCNAFNVENAPVCTACWAYLGRIEPKSRSAQSLCPPPDDAVRIEPESRSAQSLCPPPDDAVQHRPRFRRLAVASFILAFICPTLLSAYAYLQRIRWLPIASIFLPFIFFPVAAYLWSCACDQCKRSNEMLTLVLAALVLSFIAMALVSAIVFSLGLAMQPSWGAR
jgi:hypothetical protein